jgi:hypothetical protein
MAEKKEFYWTGVQEGPANLQEFEFSVPGNVNYEALLDAISNWRQTQDRHLEIDFLG